MKKRIPTLDKFIEEQVEPMIRFGTKWIGLLIYKYAGESIEYKELLTARSTEDAIARGIEMLSSADEKPIMAIMIEPKDREKFDKEFEEYKKGKGEITVGKVIRKW